MALICNNKAHSSSVEKKRLTKPSEAANHWQHIFRVNDSQLDADLITCQIRLEDLLCNKNFDHVFSFTILLPSSRKDCLILHRRIQMVKCFQNISK
jgi:hypothetical protein